MRLRGTRYALAMADDSEMAARDQLVGEDG